MTGQELSMEDLKRILREVAGVDETVDLDGDIIDVDFESLGYDSIALMEAGGRIEREAGVLLGEHLTAATTPRGFLLVVNESLTRVQRQ